MGEDSIIHELKTIRVYFRELWLGRKRFELRKNDRHFKVNDRLLLREWDRAKQEYTGREITARVSFMLAAEFAELTGIEGILSGYCVMSIDDLYMVDPNANPQFVPEKGGAE